MRKLILFFFGALVLAGSTILVWATITTGRFMNESQAASITLLSRMDVDCPPDTTRKEQPHGKSGWAIFCEYKGVRHGPWLKAEVGRLEVRGQYWMGERYGDWEWYSQDGTVFKRKTFSGEP